MNANMNTPINDGGPAFPATCSHEGIPLVVSYSKEQVSGMSLRDWFAGQALTGILAHSTTCNEQAWKSDTCAAEWSYSLADALIAARNPKPTE